MPADTYSDLTLRPWALSDAVALRAALDEDVSHLKPWLSWTLEEPATLEQTRDRLRKWIAAFETHRGYRYAIVPSARPWEILGGANLNMRFGPDAHDVGYWVRKSAVRQGIAAAAVARLAVHAFEERKVERLVLQSDVANVISASFARALGFEPIGEATIAYPDGSPRPLFRFELTRRRYLDVVAPAYRARARRVRLVEG